MIESDKLPPSETAHSLAGRHDTVLFSDTHLRKWASWLAICGTWLLGAYFFVFMVYQSTRPLPNWLLDTLKQQYGATIGTPMSAIAAFCIVTLLRATSGPIEFEALGFKFRGASGPIIMWFICFLSMIFAMWLLWQKQPA